METDLTQYVKALIHVVPGVPAAEGEGPAGDKPSRLGGAGESSQGQDSTQGGAAGGRRGGNEIL